MATKEYLVGEMETRFQCDLCKRNRIARFVFWEHDDGAGNVRQGGRVDEKCACGASPISGAGTVFGDQFRRPSATELQREDGVGNSDSTVTP